MPPAPAVEVRKRRQKLQRGDMLVDSADRLGVIWGSDSEGEGRPEGLSSGEESSSGDESSSSSDEVRGLTALCPSKGVAYLHMGCR